MQVCFLNKHCCFLLGFWAKCLYQNIGAYEKTGAKSLAQRMLLFRKSYCNQERTFTTDLYICIGERPSLFQDNVQVSSTEHLAKAYNQGNSRANAHLAFLPLLLRRDISRQQSSLSRTVQSRRTLHPYRRVNALYSHQP